MDDKTKQTLSSKTDPEVDELASPLPTCNKVLDQTNSIQVTNGEQQPLSDEFNNTNSSSKQQAGRATVVSSSQYIAVQSAILSIAESNNHQTFIIIYMRYY